MAERLPAGPVLGLRSVAVPYALVRLLGQGLEFVAFALLARQLGTNGFGVLSVAFLACRYGGLIADWGASLGGTRAVSARMSAESLHGLVRLRMVLAGGLSLLFVAIVVALGQGQLAPLAVTVLARGLARDWVALGFGRGARSGAPGLVQGVVMAGGALIVSGVASASVVIAVGYGLAGLLSVWLNRLPPRTAGATGVTTDGWLMVVALSDQVATTADTFFLAALRTSSVAGIYAAVYRIPNAWFLVIGLAINGLLPGATQALTKDRSLLPAMRQRALRYGSALSVLVLALIPVAWFALPVVFGDAYSAGRAPVAILLVATAVSTLTIGLHPLYLALHSDRVLAVWTCVMAAVNVGGDLVLIPHWGMVGAASATLISQFVSAGFFLVTVRT